MPSGEDWWGICDRHLVCSNSHILGALNVLPPVVLNPHFYWDLNDKHNVEMLLKRRWEEDGLRKYLRRFPRMMFTCASEGDTSRWMAPKFSEKVSEGVYLK